MVIGHFGVGLGLKRAAPAISLGTLFIAAQLLDLIWPTFLLLHIETVAIHPELEGARVLEFTSYPYTHSLIGALSWSILFGAHFVIQRDLRKAGVLALAVFSHWALDLIVHFHDLPISFDPASTRVGLGLWDAVLATNIIEFFLLCTGVILYLRTVRFKGVLGRIVFSVLIALLVLMQAFNIWGPPPSDVNTLAWLAQLQWLFVLLAYWINRLTEPQQTYIK